MEEEEEEGASRVSGDSSFTLEVSILLSLLLGCFSESECLIKDAVTLTEEEGRKDSVKLAVVNPFLSTTSSLTSLLVVTLSRIASLSLGLVLAVRLS